MEWLVSPTEEMDILIPFGIVSCCDSHAFTSIGSCLQRYSSCTCSGSLNISG